jgi:hypothetical protein
MVLLLYLVKLKAVIGGDYGLSLNLLYPINAATKWLFQGYSSDCCPFVSTLV